MAAVLDWFLTRNPKLVAVVALGEFREGAETFDLLLQSMFHTAVEDLPVPKQMVYKYPCAKLKIYTLRARQD